MLTSDVCNGEIHFSVCRSNSQFSHLNLMGFANAARKPVQRHYLTQEMERVQFVCFKR
jgi:hypothetical protein